MAVTATNTLPIPDTAPVVIAARAPAYRRRIIAPRSGRALEILGHAIEYLTDEYVNERNTTLSATSTHIEAVQLLMSINRQVYFECPIAPTLGERCSSFLRACLG
jgi:hypothetical protein